MKPPRAARRVKKRRGQPRDARSGGVDDDRGARASAEAVANAERSCAREWWRAPLPGEAVARAEVVAPDAGREPARARPLRRAGRCCGPSCPRRGPKRAGGRTRGGTSALQHDHSPSIAAASGRWT